MATIGFTKDLYLITSTVVDWMDVFTRPAHNPVKQEIVAKPEDFVYSSACKYYGQRGLIDVVLQPSVTQNMNKDRCRIANAYIRGGRIANPTEQKIFCN